MMLADLERKRLYQIAADGLSYRMGPFVVRLRTRQRALLDLLARVYGATEWISGEHIADFHIELRRPLLKRRWLRPQVDFFIDGVKPFEPYPLSQSLPLAEWGLNWCIAKRAQQFLMLHSAVLERHGRALILPGLPGSGKSTLCAALIHHGWRLLSDEFGLVAPGSGRLLPLPKAIPLKNRSIEVIRSHYPRARLGPVFPGTRKGDVAHVMPPAEALRRQRESAAPGWIIFPRYDQHSPLQLRPLSQGHAFARITRHSFNYHLKGEEGFSAATELTRRSHCHTLEYADLAAALDAIDQLCRMPHAA